MVPEQRAFIVTGEDGRRHTATLFKAGKKFLSCSCGAAITCCHLLAAMMSVNYEVSSSRPSNTTNLRRNNSEKQRAGKNAPRKADVDQKPKERKQRGQYKKKISFFGNKVKVSTVLI